MDPKPKEHWQVDTERLAEEILKAAGESRTEEDLKLKIHGPLGDALAEVGVDVSQVEYEPTTHTATLGRGRADAVYGSFVVEYKAPGRLGTKTGLKEARAGLEKYLRGLAGRLHVNEDDFLDRAVGVALDGHQVLFLRYTKDPRVVGTPVKIAGEQRALPIMEEARAGFHQLGPYPIAKDSLASLLIFARATGKAKLASENLARVFGPHSEVARQVVVEFYSTLTRAQSRKRASRITTFFVEWERHFGEIYPEGTEKAQTVREAAEQYGLPAVARVQSLLFTLHTYFAFLMKMIAIELLAMQRTRLVVSVVPQLGGLSDAELKEKISRIENGEGFREHGIVNFLEADFFSWYLDGWTPALASACRGIIRALNEFEPATPVLEPEWTRDLLKELYEALIPKALRHDLGEYYTPDWLAEHLLNQSGYDGNLTKRFLDPACGSGTFLVQAITRAIRWAEQKKQFSSEEAGRAILKSIVGFDLNPLAVLAARTNYLVAFAPFLSDVAEASIPVYLCDAVVPPSPEEGGGPLAPATDVPFVTTKHTYRFPLSFLDQDRVNTFTGMVETALRSGLDAGRFRPALSDIAGLTDADRGLLTAVYAKIKELDEAGENGIWARYIKNAFAPAYVGEFDFVIGNPPWIRWGYLSEEYRKRTLPLWQHYGLFSLKGHAARLGGGEKDFSMLFTYAAANRYLKDGGTLGFLITLEVVKSKGAGEGFRRFRVGDTGPPLGVKLLEDLVHVAPFQAANKTALLVLKKGEEIHYPVPAVIWRRKPGVGKVDLRWSLSQVKSATTREEVQASPVDPRKMSSPWQTSTKRSARQIEKIRGENPYRGFTGIYAVPYGVYWLRVERVLPDKKVVVANLHDRGKWKVPAVKTALESLLIYPAVTNGNIQRFGLKGTSFYLVVPQDPRTRKPYPEEWMLRHCPLTHAYLSQFKEILLSRGSKTIRELAQKTEPYAMFAVGEDTFSPYRVAWKGMGSRLEAVVLSQIETPFGRRPMVSTHTTSLIAVDSKAEAHYLCAILNSSFVDTYIKSFSAAGRGFGAPSVVQTLGIPKFSGKNALHAGLSALSERAHALVKAGKEIGDVDREIDDAVRRLWNIER